MWPTCEPADWNVEGRPIARFDHGWVLRVADRVYQYDTNVDLARSEAMAPQKVNYVAAQTSTYPTTVYVTGNTTANHQTYEFSSKDSMVLDDAGLCHYQRQ